MTKSWWRGLNAQSKLREGDHDEVMVEWSPLSNIPFIHGYSYIK